MPITAKLSRQFYEKLGDEVTNELVTWFNAVDEGYREEFRGLFEAHFGRFEARLAQQTAELRSEFDAKLGGLETRLVRQLAELRGAVDAKLGGLETRLVGRTTELEVKISGLETRLVGRTTELEVKISGLETRLIRWMFGFWVTTLLALAGTTFAALRAH